MRWLNFYLGISINESNKRWILPTGNMTMYISFVFFYKHVYLMNMTTYISFVFFYKHVYLISIEENVIMSHICLPCGPSTPYPCYAVDTRYLRVTDKIMNSLSFFKICMNSTNLFIIRDCYRSWKWFIALSSLFMK